jgi:hypothetical protein
MSKISQTGDNLYLITCFQFVKFLGKSTNYDLSSDNIISTDKVSNMLRWLSYNLYLIDVF